MEYLRELEPWKGRGGFSLDGVRKLLAQLNNPQDCYRTIHVAGTNGKGSVATFCAAMLAGSGAQVGLISSPHLSRVNERIIINGRPIDDVALDELANAVKGAAGKAGVVPTFFEAMVVAGFLAFRSSKLDWAVVEVGLGGRLDATNVLKRPNICVITTIDYDHQDILGHTLEQIAREKGGIFKPDSKVVIGELKDEPRQVLLSQANELGLEALIAGRDFSWNTRNELSCGVGYKSKKLGDYTVPIQLKGQYQAQNLATSITAIGLTGVDMRSALAGAETAFWPARLEEFRVGSRRCILDCAHNPAGVRVLKDHLLELGIGEALLVFGALETKDWKEMLRTLLPLAGEVLIAEPASPNAVKAACVAEFLSGSDVNFSVALNYREVISRLEMSDDRPAVLAGSIYLVGELRRLLLGDDFVFWRERSTCSTI